MDGKLQLWPLMLLRDGIRNVIKLPNTESARAKKRQWFHELMFVIITLGPWVLWIWLPSLKR
jgi:hypothetical protein